MALGHDVVPSRRKARSASARPTPRQSHSIQHPHIVQPGHAGVEPSKDEHELLVVRAGGVLPSGQRPLLLRRRRLHLRSTQLHPLEVPRHLELEKLIVRPVSFTPAQPSEQKPVAPEDRERVSRAFRRRSAARERAKVGCWKNGENDLRDVRLVPGELRALL